MIGPATRPVLVTHCLGCGKRLHAPTEDSLRHRMEQHVRNCNALKRRAPLKADSAPACAHDFEHGGGGSIVCVSCGLELSEKQMSEALAAYHAENPEEAH